jgi:hypothetical protein
VLLNVKIKKIFWGWFFKKMVTLVRSNAKDVVEA